MDYIVVADVVQLVKSINALPEGFDPKRHRKLAVRFTKAIELLEDHRLFIKGTEPSPAYDLVERCHKLLGNTYATALVRGMGYRIT